MIRPHVHSSSAAPYLPVRHTLEAAAAAVQTCRGCPLHLLGTRAVFGQGLPAAKLVFVGEQPGDQEEKRGQPFVGPAGRVLDEALEAAGIDRAQAFLTNAVKHFKFVPRGKRRLHVKPSTPEVRACRPWLMLELEIIRPGMIVALGATAASSLFGSEFRLMRQRGQPIETPLAPWAIATVHPSSILRVPEEVDREQAFAAFVADLRIVAEQLRAVGSKAGSTR